MIVKLYGGPAHGQTVEFNGPVYSVASGPRVPIRFGDIYEPVQFEQVNYYPELFVEEDIDPKRYRRMQVGLVQGNSLTRKHLTDLEQDWHHTVAVPTCINTA